MTSACRPAPNRRVRSSCRRARLSRGLVSRDSRLRPRHMGHSRPYRRKDEAHQIRPPVLIPSYRHPMAQASAIATLEQIATGRLMVGFGTGFTDRGGMGKKPLTLASMRTHIVQVKALLRGDIADIDGGLAQFLASNGWLPDRPINVPIYMAGQGPKARALA